MSKGFGWGLDAGLGDGERGLAAAAGQFLQINKLGVGVMAGDAGLGQVGVHFLPESVVGLSDLGVVAAVAAVGELGRVCVRVVVFGEEFDGVFEVVGGVAWEEFCFLLAFGVAFL